MAEIPKPDHGGAKPNASSMSLVHDEVEQKKTEASDDFVAIEIGALPILSVNNDKDSTSSPRISRMKNLSRKGSQRSGGGEERKAAGGEPANSSNDGPGSDVKSALLVHVAGDGETSGFSHPTTPTTAGGRYRRLGRRQTPWLDPRRVLIFFATVSSMGTMILLYFTLSMGKTAGSGANAR